MTLGSSPRSLGLSPPVQRAQKFPALREGAYKPHSGLLHLLLLPTAPPTPWGGLSLVEVNPARRCLFTPLRFSNLVSLLRGPGLVSWRHCYEDPGRSLVFLGHLPHSHLRTFALANINVSCLESSSFRCAKGSLPPLLQVKCHPLQVFVPEVPSQGNLPDSKIALARSQLPVPLSALSFSVAFGSRHTVALTYLSFHLFLMSVSQNVTSVSTRTCDNLVHCHVPRE